MATMIAEVYEDLKEAGASEEKAQAASKAIADFENRFTKANTSVRELDKKVDVQFGELRKDVEVGFARVEGQIRLLKWMVGAIVGANISLILKAFFL